MYGQCLVCEVVEIAFIMGHVDEGGYVIQHICLEFYITTKTRLLELIEWYALIIACHGYSSQPDPLPMFREPVVGKRLDLMEPVPESSLATLGS